MEKYIELAKMFDDLYSTDNGFYGVSAYSGIPTVQLSPQRFNEMFHSSTEVKLSYRGSYDEVRPYQWERSVYVDGVKFMCVCKEGINGTV